METENTREITFIEMLKNIREDIEKSLGRPIEDVPLCEDLCGNTLLAIIDFYIYRATEPSHYTSKEYLQ